MNQINNENSPNPQNEPNQGGNENPIIESQLNTPMSLENASPENASPENASPEKKPDTQISKINASFDDIDLAKVSLVQESSQAKVIVSEARVTHADDGTTKTSADDARLITSVNKISSDDASTDANKNTSTTSNDDYLKARHARDVRERLPKDGVFRWDKDHMRSSLAGADLRGADLSEFKQQNGQKGYMIEVPVKGSKENETKVVLLSEWLLNAKENEIRSAVPGLVYQEKENREFKATNFGGDNGAILAKLKKFSKEWDNSAIDPDKNFSGHQKWDIDKTKIHEDAWAKNPLQADLLTPRELQHKRAIESRYVLKDQFDQEEVAKRELATKYGIKNISDEADWGKLASEKTESEIAQARSLAHTISQLPKNQHIKESMLDGEKVKDAMNQMVENLVLQGDPKSGVYNEAFARLGNEDPNQYRDRLHKSLVSNQQADGSYVQPNDNKINRRLESFFLREYLELEKGKETVREAVSKEYNSYESAASRKQQLQDDSIKGGGKSIPSVEGEHIPNFRADLQKYNEDRRAPKPPIVEEQNKNGDPTEQAGGGNAANEDPDQQEGS